MFPSSRGGSAQGTFPRVPGASHQGDRQLPVLVALAASLLPSAPPF